MPSDWQAMITSDEFRNQWNSKVGKATDLKSDTMKNSEKKLPGSEELKSANPAAGSKAVPKTLSKFLTSTTQPKVEAKNHIAERPSDLDL